MTTLPQTQTKINTDYPDWYVASIAREALAAAEVFYVEQQTGLTWETVCAVYLTIFGQVNDVDLSQTPIPAVPEIDNWLAGLDEADLDDYIDALSQQHSGVQMF